MSSFSRPPSTYLTPLPEVGGLPPREAAVVGPPSWRTIWRLSWPLVLTMVCNALIGLVDTWIAGRIGPTQQAAVGLTVQLILLVNATTTAVSIGCQALVSRFVGAENWAEAGTAARQALLLGLWLSLAVLVPMYALAPWLFEIMGATPAVRDVGTWYLRLLLIGLLPMDLAILMNAIFRAQGLTRAILLNTGVEAIVSTSCSLALGWWAGWGLAGLALGFVLGKLMCVMIAWTTLSRSPVLLAAGSGWRSQPAWFKRIAHVGVPAGMQVIFRNLGMMAFFGILMLSRTPTEAVAAFSIGYRIESIAFLPVFALNIATATLVGQNLGAGMPEQAARAGWRVALLGMSVSVAFGLIFFFAAEPLARLFTQDPVVFGLTADYLRVIAISEPSLALVMVLNGALQGAGDARTPMVCTFIAQILFRLPLAYWLVVPLGWGPAGAWWAMTVSMLLQSMVVVWQFRRGTWRDRRI